MVKTRFAPSPTGVMHLGNLRTALVNALYAHGQGGTFLLRVENTDKERSKDEYAQQILKDLAWLDIEIDEGPIYQSDRDDIYKSYFDQLITDGKAYPCFCSEQELAIHRKAQLSAGIAPRYPGTCQHLTDEQVAQKVSAGLKPSLRFRVPKEKIIRFEDAIFGPKQFLSDDLGDFIIRKNDGGPTFMFCNAIDDALMEVTHAFRGEDHITNTPRQLMLLEALGLQPPIYGHFPIILGMDGKPLSKRNGSQSVIDLREKGFLPEAILNYIARLGHSYENPYYLSNEELATAFQLRRVGTSPSKFDPEQLNHWQDTAWLHIPEQRAQDALAEVKSTVPEEQWPAFVEIIKQNIRFQADAMEWAHCLFDNGLPAEEHIDVLRTAGKSYFVVLLDKLQTLPPKEALLALKSELDIKGKALFMPFRVAITGRISGPTFDELYQLLSASQIKSRIEMVINKLGE